MEKLTEVLTMTASYTCMSNSGSCCAMSAVAGTSARLAVILDTAVFAVSIIIIRLLGVLVLGI